MNEAASLAPVGAAVACGSEAVFPRRWQPRPGQGASGPLRQPGVTAGRLPRLVLRRRSARQDVSPVTAIPGSLTPRILNRTSGVRFEPPPPQPGLRRDRSIVCAPRSPAGRCGQPETATVPPDRGDLPAVLAGGSGHLPPRAQGAERRAVRLPEVFRQCWRRPWRRPARVGPSLPMPFPSFGQTAAPPPRSGRKSDGNCECGAGSFAAWTAAPWQ